MNDLDPRAFDKAHLQQPAFEFLIGNSAGQGWSVEPQTNDQATEATPLVTQSDWGGGGMGGSGDVE